MPSQDIQPKPGEPADMRYHWPGLAQAAAFVIEREGTRLAPYLDTAGVWTIGNGTTTIDGRPVTKFTPVITIERAHELMEDHLVADAEVIYSSIIQPLTENQYAALLSLTYNEGAKAVRNSTIVHLINEGRLSDARSHFTDWCMEHDPNSHRLVYSQGLMNRRLAEQRLWDTPDVT